MLLGCKTTNKTCTHRIYTLQDRAATYSLRQPYTKNCRLIHFKKSSGDHLATISLCSFLPNISHCIKSMPILWMLSLEICPTNGHLTWSVRDEIRAGWCRASLSTFLDEMTIYTGTLVRDILFSFCSDLDVLVFVIHRFPEKGPIFYLQLIVLITGYDA